MEPLDELTPETGGRWAVQARSSVHVWDLDAHTCTRLPRTPEAAMANDGMAHPITAVAMWPRVGGASLVLFDEPGDPDLEHWHTSGTILAITRLPEADPADPSAAGALPLVNVHDPSECAGRGCVIHHPSQHHIRSWPLNWRQDLRAMERICRHGIGHPDPDDLAWQVSQGRSHAGVHSCDGCCAPPN